MVDPMGPEEFEKVNGVTAEKVVRAKMMSDCETWADFDPTGREYWLDLFSTHGSMVAQLEKAALPHFANACEEKCVPRVKLAKWEYLSTDCSISPGKFTFKKLADGTYEYDIDQGYYTLKISFRVGVELECYIDVAQEEKF